MELTKVKINNYKSIENPIEIDLNGGSHFITFIGKNGSGKTNILRALKLALSKHSFHSVENYKSGMVAEYELSLTDQE
ncbi:MAG: AAA family ATPase, partial [Clostridiales bacterium]|nr:AAA family ATPase [Clostridiales bacterium]